MGIEEFFAGRGDEGSIVKAYDLSYTLAETFSGAPSVTWFNGLFIIRGMGLSRIDRPVRVEWRSRLDRPTGLVQHL